MKKHFFKALLVAVLMGGTLPLQAQYSHMYYHRVGDTIENDSPIYYHSWWNYETFYDNNIYIWPTFFSSLWGQGRAFHDSCEILQYYYTPVPLKIIGIAGSGCRVPWHPDSLDRADEAYWDTNEIMEYFRIYDAGPGDTFNLVASVHWSTNDPRRTLHLKTRKQVPGDDDIICCGSGTKDSYFPIFEYYFDSAIYVTDSFYVGGTAFGDYQTTTPELYTLYGAASIDRGYSCDSVLVPSTPLCTIPGLQFKKKMGNYWQPNNFSYSDAPWIWVNQESTHSILDNHDPGMIFPIIEVDTTVPPRDACEPITGVEALPNDSSVVVTWDGFPNYTAVKLRYGRPNLPTSQWTELDVTGYTVYSLVGLEPSTRYGVSLMAMCDSCKKQTPWTEPVYFYTAADTTHHDTTGITAPSLLASQTFLQPNPANDEVTVSSSFSLKRIELHDAAGVLVYSEPSFGHQATVSLHLLRAGTYIVTIETEYGTTHKRLVKM